ncbi:MAG: type II CRISPR-associated endonuclease Cas1, partial [Planctomycetota bacterium]
LAKLDAQSAALETVRGKDCGIARMKTRVRSGDPENIEAQAARRYWGEILSRKEFRRVREAVDENQWLNYGYAVLRAIIGRAICGSGLHPSLGVHHHNRYNAFCLADDLMEPFRPIVDLAVVDLLAAGNCPGELTPEIKRSIISKLTARHAFDGQQRTLFDVASTQSASLANAFVEKKSELQIPRIQFHSVT